ncbi:MAG: hypothetical protein IJ137_10705 [Eubacterium sp.]|nr:hypothetical protein [Eubacterium sp.]
MKKNQHITAFYLETILLIVVFMAIIMVLTNVFGAGRRQTVRARRLNNAVCLAENAAEAVSASDSLDKLETLLNQADNARRLEEGMSPGLVARYDENMSPDPEGHYMVLVSWTTAGSSVRAGDYVESTIKVIYEGLDEPLYVLDTGVYVKEVGE